MLKLEQQLADDKSGRLKNGIRRSLYTELNRVEAELNKGVSPDCFAALNKYSQSVKSAYEIVDIVWQNRHRCN